MEIVADERRLLPLIRGLLHEHSQIEKLHKQRTISGATAMQTLKQIVHDIADQLSEQATFNDAIQALYVRQKLAEGLKDLDEGRTYTQEEVEQRLLSNRI